MQRSFSDLDTPEYYQYEESNGMILVMGWLKLEREKNWVSYIQEGANGKYGDNVEVATEFKKNN